MLPEPQPEPDTGWLALPRCRLGSQVLPMVLLHPRHGIAIQGGPPEAAALVRERLERARFSAIFPGVLPILRLAEGQSPEAAFAGQEPVRLPGGDAWSLCARRALERDAPQGQLVPLGSSRRHRNRRGRRIAVAAGLLALLLGGMAMSMIGMKPAQSSLVAAPAGAPWAGAP